MSLPSVILVLSTLLLVVPNAKAGASPMKTPVTLDLHSHLWIKDGTTLILQGDFEEPVRADSAKSMLKSKMTRASLDPSGLRLIVVSLYAHPILARFHGNLADFFDPNREPVRESLQRQIASAEAFVVANPSWVIAADAREARAALARGKRVLVLSIETAEGAFNTEEDRALFVDQKKVAIVTFVHLSPDRLGRGVALMPGPAVLNAPLEWLSAFFTKTVDARTGAYLNATGLSPYGKEILGHLVKKGVWIDLAHSSDETLREMAPILDRAGQPSLFTHTKLRDRATSERALPEFAVARLRKTQGLVGLMPTDSMIDRLPDDDLPDACRKGIYAFAEEWKETVKQLGSPAAVALGSDANAPLVGLAGGCDRIEKTADPTFVERGFYRGEDLPQLFAAMQGLGVDFGASPNAAIDRFLTAWEKVRPASARATRSKSLRSP